MPNIANVYIEGCISSDYLVNTEYDMAHCSLKQVRAQVDAQPDSDGLRVVINSEGGQVTEGFGIYDYLTSLNKPVTTVAIGQCCSIATVIFMAGQTRLMAENAQFMVHLPSGGVYGNINDLTAYSQLLQQDTDRLVNFYTNKTGQTANVITGLVSAETFLTSEQTVNYGFATGLYKPATALYIQSQPTKPTPKMAKKHTILATALRQVFAILSGTPTVNMAVNLADGTAIEVETTGTTPAVGDSVKLADASDAPDADYDTADGLVLTVLGGVIVAIETKEVETAEPANAEIVALRKEVADMKAAHEKDASRISAILRNMESADVDVVPKPGNVPDIQGKPKAQRDTSREEMHADHKKKYGVK